MPPDNVPSFLDSENEMKPEDRLSREINELMEFINLEMKHEIELNEETEALLKKVTVEDFSGKTVDELLAELRRDEALFAQPPPPPPEDQEEKETGYQAILSESVQGAREYIKCFTRMIEDVYVQALAEQDTRKLDKSFDTRSEVGAHHQHLARMEELRDLIRSDTVPDPKTRAQMMKILTIDKTKTLEHTKEMKHGLQVLAERCDGTSRNIREVFKSAVEAHTDAVECFKTLMEATGLVTSEQTKELDECVDAELRAERLKKLLKDLVEDYNAPECIRNLKL